MRLDSGVLTITELDSILAMPRLRPMTWFDYIHAIHGLDESRAGVWGRFPLAMPWSILDDRLVDVALDFQARPTDSLLRGFRRLEDTIRSRTRLADGTAKLMSQAFGGDRSPLMWPVADPSEQTGRMQLFTGAFQAYRNAHAHRELDDDPAGLMNAFLLLNHLYALEREAVPR